MRIRSTIGLLALALAVLAAGAVALAAPNRPAPSLRAAANHRAARRDAIKLLRRLQLPAGAVAVGRDPSPDGRLGHASSEPASGELVDAHRFWRVPGDPGDVIAWFESHTPAGGSVDGTGSGSGPGYEFDSVTIAFDPVPGVIISRQLVIEATAARGGGTALRVDAEDISYVPRPRSERVPTGITVIGVKIRRLNQSNGSTSTESRTVTDATTVRRIVTLVNALPPAQPGVEACPADFGPDLTLSFLTAPGATPSAVAVAEGSGCGGVSFVLDGRREPGLSGGDGFVAALGKLLGFAS